MVYFDQILHTYAWQHCLITGMHYSIFDGRVFAEHQSGRSSFISKNAHKNEPHDIFGSNCILIYFKGVQPPLTQNDDEAAGRILNVEFCQKS